jgi:hypothetical protein
MTSKKPINTMSLKRCIARLRMLWHFQSDPISPIYTYRHLFPRLRMNGVIVPPIYIFLAVFLFLTILS